MKWPSGTAFVWSSLRNYRRRCRVIQRRWRWRRRRRFLSVGPANPTRDDTNASDAAKIKSDRFQRRGRRPRGPPVFRRPRAPRAPRARISTAGRRRPSNRAGRNGDIRTREKERARAVYFRPRRRRRVFSVGRRRPDGERAAGEVYETPAGEQDAIRETGWCLQLARSGTRWWDVSTAWSRWIRIVEILASRPASQSVLPQFDDLALASPAMGHWGTCPLDLQQFNFFQCTLTYTESDSDYSRRFTAYDEQRFAYVWWDVSTFIIVYL